MSATNMIKLWLLIRVLAASSQNSARAPDISTWQHAKQSWQTLLSELEPRSRTLLEGYLGRNRSSVKCKRGECKQEKVPQGGPKKNKTCIKRNWAKSCFNRSKGLVISVKSKSLAAIVDKNIRIFFKVRLGIILSISGNKMYCVPMVRVIPVL